VPLAEIEDVLIHYGLPLTPPPAATVP